MTDIASRLAKLTPQQRAQLSARVTAAPSRPAAEPIAIIGIGCRFPGGAVSPERFWERLLDRMDAIGKVPADRWLPDGENPNLSSWGAFLENLDQFDRSFFGLSPREAAHMDPQQRLLLETAWEALEDAGQMNDRLAESATGVFIGAHSHSSDYFLLQAEAQRGYDTYSATGSAHSILANRLSFVLDLRGPSLVIDTACSSSLVAAHMACQSLRAGEIDMAIVGGVNLMLTQDFHGCLRHMEMLAPDGRCKTFDHRANGFVRGEGCGVVVLKRLADARREGDPVSAVIVGSAVNQDGASNGLTAPNGLAQQAVIRRALEAARVAPDEVGYVETHGTGTQLGDPIEVEALAKVLRPGDAERGTCVLGALKTNIGHLEGAAGVAGLIKVALALRNEAIPGNLHLEAVNPHLADYLEPFTLPAETYPWPRSDRRRVAGVSSFGFGGTNAHVLLAEAPLPLRAPPAAPGATPLLLPVSARSEQALRALAEDYATFLTGSGAAMPPADLAYTAAHRRLHHDRRMCAVGSGPAEWAASLRRQLAQGVGSPTQNGSREIVFVFSGQGGQRAQAGAQLLASEPAFRTAIDACDAALRKHAAFSLVDELRAAPGTSRLARADVGQPALFALQVGLDALWRSWGVHPSRVVGHSVGEIAAAHAAGALSLTDAMTVAFHRGRILQEAPADLGGMAMVALSPEEAGIEIASHDGAIGIAAYNSPVSCILSGPTDSLRSLVATLQARAVFARMLDIDYPSHTPRLAPFASRLESALAGLKPAPLMIPMVSTVTGQPAEAGAFDAAYWARNLRQPVLFARAIETLATSGASIFLEIGPQPVLGTAIEQCETDAGGPLTVAASLARDQADDLAMREGLATLYRAGVALDWARLAPTAGKCVTLPRYAWDRQSYWLPKPPAARPKTVAAPDSVPQSWLYELAWRAAEPIGHGASVLAQVDLDRSGARLASEVAKRAPAGNATVREGLDTLSAHYILEAFGELGADLTPGAIWPKRSLASKLGIEPRFERLLGRMAGILVDQNVVAEEPMGWRVVGPPGDVDVPRVSLGGEAEPALSLLTRCGPQLAGVLRGEVDPLTLLFSGEEASAEAIYRDATPSRRSNELLAEGVRQWLAELPPDASFRIIEIGAGTGATTEGLLALLPRDRCEYVFTDVSLAFLAKARERFGDYPFVRYELLDLEQDVSAEECAAGSFDLVIAANVLHATSDVREALARMRALLAPAGVLALVECTAAHPWMDITFGLTDGWWRFTDIGLRRSHPLLDAAQWEDVLAQSGFAAAAIPLQSGEGDPILDQALVLARGPGAEQAEVAPPRGRYLIVDEGCGSATKLADRLRERGDECLVVPAESLRTADPSGAWRAIIYLAAATTPDLATAGSALLALTQWLIRAGTVTTRGLWIVTEGCQPRGDMPAATLWQSLLWGMGRGIALEAPELAPVLLDLDPADADAAATILEEIDHPTPEDQIVRRGRQRLVPRVQPLAADALAASPLKITGRHLVTGGLGGIGSRLARELARAGAGELVLLVNRSLPDRATWDRIPSADPEFKRIDTVRALEASGVSVLVEVCDFANFDALDTLLTSPSLTARPLNGIWHAAMLVTPRELMTMDDSDLAATIAVKARAARRLDELTRSRRLDQFVLFSSTTSLWGARGFAHYAAANAYLDALAHARRAEGLAATVVNWGTWDITDGAAGGHLTQAQRAGLTPMRPDAAFGALRQVVASGRAQTIVADVDWEQFKAAYEARRARPLLSAIGAVPPAREARPAPGGDDDLIARLGAAAPEVRDEIVRELVAKAVAAVLAIDDHATIERNRGFFELGMDSLTSVQLRRRLEAALSRPLSATVAFKYPTVDALSAHIIDLFRPVASIAAATPPVSAVRAPEAPLVDHADASEDELFDMLAARLSSGRA